MRDSIEKSCDRFPCLVPSSDMLSIALFSCAVNDCTPSPVVLVQ